MEQGGRTWQKERARTGLGWRPEKLAPMLMPKRRMKREQPMMHPICRLQQQPQHFLWGCSIPPRVAADKNSLLIIPPQEHARKQERGCPQDRCSEFVMRLKRTTG